MFPKELKIGGRKFKIQFIDDRELPDYCAGRLLDEAENIIEINDRYKNTEMAWIILFHEVFHAVNAELEETTTEFLAQAVYQILRDNNINLHN